MRWAAREALQELACLGLDLTKPLFAGHEVNGHTRGSVGLTLLGFPDILATPPHEARAEQLHARLARLHEQVGDDDQWFGALRDAEAPFQERDELPADESLRDALLALCEMDALLRTLKVRWLRALRSHR